MLKDHKHVVKTDYNAIRGNMPKNIPNIISIIRIVMSVLLFTVFNNIVLFIILYILIGFSDILDGFIARKYKLETILGAKLDTFADFIFYIVLLIYIFVGYESVIIENIVLIGIVLFFRLCTIFINLIKYKKIFFIHTIANKSAGVLIFFMPILLYLKIKAFIILVLLVAIFSAIEECAIAIKSKNIELNKKSIFH